MVADEASSRIEPEALGLAPGQPVRHGNALQLQRERLIDDAARKIREIVFSSTLELTLKIGEVIIQDLYAGSFRAWRKRGRKCNSLRTLASRPDLPMSATAVYRAVAIYELVMRAGGIEAFSKLGVSHFRAVLSLADEEQLRCLRDADVEGWTAAELHERTQRLGSGTRGGRGGRRPMNPVHRAVRCAARALGGDATALPTAVNVAGSAQLHALQGEVEALLLRVLELAEALGVALPLRRGDEGRAHT